MSITKNGPFPFPKLSEQHPLYARLLAREVQKLISLPDFSEDKSLFILSDFGGEHKEAAFATYSILICSYDKRLVFEAKMKQLREKYRLNEPWKEFAFKDLKYGPVSRSLTEFLDLADNFVHGLLLTISVDKAIESLFGHKKRDAHNELIDLFRDHHLGEWKGEVAEKTLRVCHAIGIFMSLVAYSGQKILWLCDHDSINTDGNKRDFTDTQKIFVRCLSMYSDNLYEIYGFARPFERDAGTADLLSLSDFAAGTIQEILQNKIKCKDFQFSAEKVKLIKWMGTESRFLSKVNLTFIKKPDGDLGVGTVDIQAKK